MGKVIGRSYAQLTQIKDDTGAEFKTDPKSNQDGALYIRGPIESQKRAIRKIKEIVVSPVPERFSTFRDAVFNKHKEKGISVSQGRNKY